MDVMSVDISQVLSNMPIAGAMIWFAYHITNESRKERMDHYKSAEHERKEWAQERRIIYEEIINNLHSQTSYIQKNTETLKNLIDNN